MDHIEVLNKTKGHVRPRLNWWWGPSDRISAGTAHFGPGDTCGA